MKRFWAKVEKTPTCWLWLASRRRDGYGRFSLSKGRPVLAHRVAWEMARGPIPKGLQIDHLCRVRHCVRPDHMEIVTARTNVLRGDGPAAKHARKTHCIHGHKFTPKNTYIWNGGRFCRACNLRAVTAYKQRTKGAHT